MTWDGPSTRSGSAPARAPFAVTLGCALALALPALAQAEEGLGAFYVALRAIGSIAAFDGVAATGFSGTTLVQNDSDEVAGLAGVLGYRFASVPVRVELEAGHRFRFDFDVRDVVGTDLADYEMDVATNAILVNGILEWRNTSQFTPFVGASLGWARNTTETQRTVLRPVRAQTNHEEDVDNFVWGGLVGLDWAFAENWSAELAYRYIDLGEVDTGLMAGGETISADEYVSHDVLLAVVYRF